MIDDIQKIIGFCSSNGKIFFKKHALIRATERNITIEEIEMVLNDCIIISEYIDDKPFPSYLLCGFTKQNRPLHLVIAVDSKEKYIWIITVYEPDRNFWNESYTRRLI